MEVLVGKIAISICSFGLVVFARIIYVIYRIRQRRRKWIAGETMPHSASHGPIKTFIILGSGGHTGEMLHMTKHLNRKDYFPVEYCIASSDTTSIMKLCHQHPPSQNLKRQIHSIPRARHVGQSYLTSFFTTLHAFVHSLVLMTKVRPGLILCNGPGTVLPLCVAALLVRFVTVWGRSEGPTVVFVESFCRVQTLSLTGQLLYPWVDMFIVHWEELHRKFPNSNLIDTFVAG